MNKFLVLLFSIFSFQTIAQETLHFNMHYKPDTKYIAETIMTMEATTTQTGSDAFMSYFRETGIDSISKEKESTKAILELSVLSTDSRGYKPVEMKYISLKTNGVENNYVSGLSVEGSIQGSALPVFHTIRNSNFDSNFDREFLLMINQMFEQIKFPNVVLAVGESYEDTIPFVMPIGNLELNMEINSNYLLKEIKNKRAYFELIQFGNIVFTDSVINFTGEFNGSGFVYYDLEFDFMDEYQLDFTYDINYYSDYNNFTILVDTKVYQKFDIEKL